MRGSALIGQNFTGNGYFHGRPSATAEMPYNPQASGGSNLAVSNPELDKLIAARVAALRAANPDASASVPVELVTASASGLDNNITPQAAAWQIPRVAKARNLSVEQLTQLIAKYSQQPLVKYIGQPVVNIVELNLALDKIHRGEEEVHLTPIEFRLLAVLLNNAGKVLTQRQLLNQVWGPNAVEHSHYLRIYMGHLRQKLEQDPARPRHFITETGIGYRFML